MAIQGRTWGRKGDRKQHLCAIFKIIPLRQQFVPLPTAFLLLCCDNVLQGEKRQQQEEKIGIKRQWLFFRVTTRKGI